jgi:hypothetical protein
MEYHITIIQTTFLMPYWQKIMCINHLIKYKAHEKRQP